MLGHLLGDYVFQGRMMATTKGQLNNIVGWLNCILHCLIYTICIVIAMNRFVPDVKMPMFALGIFFSHFLIDKFNFTSWWLRTTGGRTFEYAASEPDSEKRPFSIGFTCLMYAVVDNTFHIFLMCAVIAYTIGIKYL